MTFARFIPQPESPALLCFPAPGLPASLYADWSRELAPVCQVVAIERSLLLSPEQAVRPWTSRPYVLFGHGPGALDAYETAKRLERDGRPPRLIIVSGRNSPSVPAMTPRLNTLSWLAPLSGLPRGGWPGNASRRPPAPPLSCPLVALYGAEDALTSREYVAGWADETTDSSWIGSLPGGHFYFLSPGFPARLRSILKRELSGRAIQKSLSR